MRFPFLRFSVTYDSPLPSPLIDRILRLAREVAGRRRQFLIRIRCAGAYPKMGERIVDQETRQIHAAHRYEEIEPYLVPPKTTGFKEF